ncbi:uncharacterized protein BP01DRAFT_27142 [Aspergillus saccharolyticus JOP 1030-1]|uniref:Secreted protein n=1 Tax=Aspergillus saccharolyticus JOP 1030-1 TaxID=1450539 RepID=A0A318ZFF1_9EURO|nr:hypothetical protein BP01DRAFT_27142 [Aspergillus saccharolyticus JOP 1030-1]PYH46271.1 hypothetical protein BP01DRAFT_27142 [Aspergillus saccharolyticus JOP 1030-1]
MTLTLFLSLSLSLSFIHPNPEAHIFMVAWQHLSYATKLLTLTFPPRVSFGLSDRSLEISSHSFQHLRSYFSLSIS